MNLNKISEKMSCIFVRSETFQTTLVNSVITKTPIPKIQIIPYLQPTYHTFKAPHIFHEYLLQRNKIKPVLELVNRYTTF